MYSNIKSLSAVTFSTLLFAVTARAVTVQSSGEAGGPDAAALVAKIADPASNYTIVPGSESTTINASGNPDSDLRAMGTFSSGITAPGSLLPATNQNSAGDAVYAGGLGIESGICLCTGLSTDHDSQVSGVPADRGVGIEGPNRGFGLNPSGFTVGEINFPLGKPSDADFVAEVAAGSDATVLQFKITLTSPGILSIRFVHGSDEHPQHSLGRFNDTPLLFVGDENGQNLENIITFIDQAGVENTLTLLDLDQCGLLIENLVAPSPAILQNSPHAAVDTTLHFDHEFGGFTKPITKESCCVYAPGTYTIKIVLQDVDDDAVDSAIFLEENSLKLFPFLAADFNLDGKVGPADLGIVGLNWAPTATDKKFTEGDANGDGAVGPADLGIVSLNWQPLGGGNTNFCADFDRDGNVTGQDFLIYQKNQGLDQCASRAEGDANRDGKVGTADLAIWEQEHATGVPAGTCDCNQTQQASGGGGQSAVMLAGPQAAPAANLATNPDIDGDGDVDTDDIEQWIKVLSE